MPYEHGITILENPTAVIPPLETDSAVQVIIGTAPVNLAKDITKAVNIPILCYSLQEAIDAVGYSDDWDKYTLCQAIDASFRVFNVAPIILINVLDPATHKESVASASVSVTNGVATIEVFGVLLDDSFIVKDSTETTTYVKGTDYTVAFNSDGYPVITRVATGTIPEAVTELKVSYNKLKPDAVTTTDIIGGYDSATSKYSGMECIKQIYPMFNIVPGQIIAPGWSHKPEVAAALATKCEKINGSFNCISVVDIDCSEADEYSEVPEWKSTNSYTFNRQIIMWPKVKVGDKTYWYSAIMAALIAYTDAQNENVPYKSPSNKTLPITAIVLADGSEVYLDQLQANFLNGAGVVTAVNIAGWRTWGNNTGAYPASTDPKDRFISVRRVFDWWGNTFILTYFQKVDDPTNYRLIESVVDSENIRANGFQAKGQIAGAQIEFREQDNPLTDILNGKIQFIQKIGAFPPAVNIVNVLEFDPTMLSSALFGGE